MRYRAAAVVVALAAAVAIGQVPMYSDYPWGLVNNGTDQGPVWNLNCVPPLWCSVPTFGNGQVQLGDGGVLPITVAFASDAGQALLAGFAAYAADAGLANRSSRADFADDAGFAIFAGDAGRAFISNFSDYASDAGYSHSAGLAGVATYALDAGLASKAIAADFARDAGSSASADVATYALDAGLAVAALWAGDAGFANSSSLAALATYALDAGLSAKAIAADFARDAGSAANADFARDAGSAASADLATFALDAGRSVFAGFAADAGLSVAALYAGDAGLSVASLYAADAGLAVAALYAGDAGLSARATLADTATVANYASLAADSQDLNCTTCVDTADIAAGAVTTTELGNMSVTPGKLPDGVSLSAYDEATPAALHSRSTVVNGTKGTFDGTLAYVAYTATTATASMQVTTGLYTGTSTDQRTTDAVVRFRARNTAIGKLASVTAVNTGNTAQTASMAGFSLAANSDGNWYVGVFDLSGWTTVGTLRVDFGWTAGVAPAGAIVDISYAGAGNAGSGTGALVSYRGNVGIGAPTPAAPLEISGAHVTNRGLLSLTSSASSIAAITLYPEGTYAGALYGNTDDSVWLGTAGATSLSLYTNGTANPRLAIDSNGAATINKPSSGNSLTLTGTNGVVGVLQSTSNTATSQTRLQLYHYGANGGSPVLETYAARGTLASPSSPNSGDVLGSWIGYGRTVSAFTEGARVEMLTTAAAGTSTLTTAIDFYTANAAASARKMRLDAAGYLGLGTTTIPAQVTVFGAGQTTGTFNTAGNLGGTIYLRDSGSGSGNGGAVMFGASQGAFAVIKGLLVDGSNNTRGDIEFAARNATTDATLTARMKIFGTGDVRVYNLAGVGNRAVYSDADGDLTNSSSDATLKTAIEDIRAPLRMVLNLRPVSFNWKDAQRFGPQREVGFLAQEVMQAIPEVVGRNSDGTYTVDYPKIVAVVVGAIQELYDDRQWMLRRIQELEDRAQKAEDSLARIEARLTSLENYSGIKGCGDCPQKD